MKIIKITNETIMASFNKAMTLFQSEGWAIPVISNFSFPNCQKETFHKCFIHNEKSGKRVLSEEAEYVICEQLTLQDRLFSANQKLLFQVEQAIT